MFSRNLTRIVSISATCSGRTPEAFFSRVTSAAFSATAIKSSLLATKSVSHNTSTMAIRFPSCFTTIRPSAAVRSVRLAIAASPFSLRSFSAAAKSPLDSTRAFLQSERPAPVESRSAFTSDALISILFSFERAGEYLPKNYL